MSTVISKIPQFKISTLLKVGNALESLAGEIERDAKMVVPHDKGILQSSIRTKKIDKTHYQVTAGEFPALPYARRREYEEANYSKPGKKAHYLEDSGNSVAKKAGDRFRKYL